MQAEIEKKFNKPQYKYLDTSRKNLFNEGVSISQVLTNPNSVEMLKDDLNEDKNFIDKYFEETA